MIPSLIAMLAIATPAQPPATVSRLPVCTPAQLSLGFDGEGGAFDGMSHSGALLVVRNIGPAACRIEGLPTLTFRGPDGVALDVVRQAPVGMHPGPVVRPVGLAPGAEATAPLRWVSGDAYGGGRCRRVASARLAIAGQTTRDQAIGAALTATICSSAGQPARFDQPPLQVDPTL